MEKAIELLQPVIECEPRGTHEETANTTGVAWEVVAEQEAVMKARATVLIR